MDIKRLLFAIFCTVAILATSSCVDDRYDLDNVSGDVHLFENGVNLPLLQTGDLFFDDLVSSEDDIVVNEKGIYEFSTNKDEISFDLEIVEKVKIPQEVLDFGPIKSYDVIAPEGSATFALPSAITDYEADLHSETPEIDSRVTRIDTILTHEDWRPSIRFDILDDQGNQIKGDISIDKITFSNYKLELPSCLIIDKNNVSASDNITVTTFDDSNVLELNGETSSGSVFVDVKIEGVNIENGMFVNQKIILDEEVRMYGGISLSVSNRGSVKTQSLQVRPSLTIPEIYMDEAIGTAIMEDEIDDEKLYIGTLPEFLKDPATSLILTNPYVPIVIETTVPMDTIYADIVLEPRDENGNNIYDNDGNPIKIEIKHMAVPGDDHDTPGPTISYEYVACQEIPELKALGYDFVKCSELGMITKQIPSYIEVSGRGYTDPDHVYDFYMGEDYLSKIYYEVRVPFMLEADSRIVYSESTTDLNTDVFETLSASKIFANAKILNGFPADMELAVELYDINGDKIDGVDVIIPEKIKASETTILTENVEPAETNMKVEIYETVKGAMQKIDRMDWTVNVSFPDKGLVSKYQSLNIKIDLELPEGVDINFDNL
ncbi:MAG: hypothetical protein IKK64_07970 [Bacteroidales bacterium]|nr:hypothetical protein [Bacteroidales bacterium]